MTKQSEELFYTELKELINKHSRENGSNTPDFVLAEYLFNCLRNFDQAVNNRATRTLKKGA